MVCVVHSRYGKSVGEIMMLPSAFNIMPVENKKPLVPWQDLIEREQTNEERSKILQAAVPGKIGIICGPVSRIFVLDIDGPNGEESVKKFHVPPTWTVKTPHGKHVYFKWVPELEHKITTRTAILSGVDVRGEGGYVVFYGWERGPHLTALMAPPQWLIDLLPNKNTPKVIGDTFKKLDYVEALQNLKEGNRNDTFTRLAGGLRAKGFEFKEIYEFLFPKAKEVGFDERELQTVCQSICRYPAGQRPPISEILVPDNVEQFLQDEERVEYIVPGIFSKNSIGFMAGLPETCKTWTLLDLAVELARKDGGTWLGRFPVKHSKVLYIDQERAKSETQRRFKALIAAKNITTKDLNDSLVIKCGTTIRLNLQESFNSFKQLLTKVRPNVILIDSFKTFHTHDINSNVQMQEVMERIKELKNEFGCTFIFIYHENKGAFDRVDAQGKKKQITFEHMAGAAVMSEVPETILITVKQDQDSSFLHHVKNTYGQKVAPVLVNVENVTPDKSQIKVIAR
jgi:hypothetical protein